ncbi:MAG: PLP-dependent aminotransferase family protein [Halanaerobiales bacterium]|nr:PLP-dependent aminotransferase family protein [Halanaerobiales bacterium]
MFEQIRLDKQADQHLYIQLYQQVKEMIEKGILEEHQKLPPIRQLAELLKVNNVTIVNAYKLLEEDGLVIKKVGSGTYVAPIFQKIDREERFLDEEIQLMNQGQVTSKQNMISFATATPDPEYFPIQEVKNAINHVLDRDGGEVFGYQESLGYQPLREAFHQYLLTKGIKCQVKNIQVVSGAQQGIDILAKVLLNHGDVVFTEEPTYTGAISAFKSRGARLVSIPIREDGIDLEILETQLAEYQPKFLYIMTSFQNPTGYSYTEEKKTKLLELSRKWGLTIVEDDSLSELYFIDNPIPSLKSMNGAEDVIYIKSFSKIFMPGFRIAFMVSPDMMVSQMMAAKHSSDISSSGLIQRTFDLLLRRDLWEKHIEEMRQNYFKKYQFFVKLLRQELPEQVKYIIPGGGLNFWLALPEGFLSNRLYKKCLNEGVIIVPGSVFYPDGRPNRFFRLSIATVEEAEMIKGIRILSHLSKELLSEQNLDDHITFTPFM